MHFILCQTCTDILGIVNEFVQFVQNYFQYVYIAILPEIEGKNLVESHDKKNLVEIHDKETKDEENFYM